MSNEWKRDGNSKRRSQLTIYIFLKFFTQTEEKKMEEEKKSHFVDESIFFT